MSREGQLDFTINTTLPSRCKGNRSTVAVVPRAG